MSMSLYLAKAVLPSTWPVREETRHGSLTVLYMFPMNVRLARWLLAILLIGTFFSVLVTESRIVAVLVIPAVSRISFILSLYLCVPWESAVFSQDFFCYAVERDGDGPCIFLDCLGWDVFHYAVNHIFPRHFEEVSDPASYVALEYEDVFLGFESRIGAHVGPVYPSDFVKCQVDRCAVPFRTYPEVPERGGGYEFLGDAPVEECAKLLEYAVHVVASPFPDSGTCPECGGQFGMAGDYVGFLP